MTIRASATRAAVASAAAAALLLTGCSGAQSPEQACRVLQESVQESAAALEEGMAGFGSDPADALAGMHDANDSFAAAVDEISNEDVLAKAEPANDALDELAAATEALGEDPEDGDRVTAFTDATIAVQTTFEDIGTVCS